MTEDKTQATTAAPKTTSRKWLDFCGIGLSTACGIHCLVTPLLLLLAPALAHHWTHPSVHLILAFLVAPLVLVVTGLGYKKHQRRWVLASAWIGVSLILIALIPANTNTAQAATTTSNSSATTSVLIGSQAASSPQTANQETATQTADQNFHCSSCAAAAGAGSSSSDTDEAGNPTAKAGFSWPTLNRHSGLTLLGGLLLIGAHIGNVAPSKNSSNSAACQHCNASDDTE